MAMVSVRTESHKLIAKGFRLAAPDLVANLVTAQLSAERFELYDLKADAREQQNLLLSPKPEVLKRAEALRKKLVQWRVDIVLGTAAQDPSKVDPKVAEQLRKHGYWSAE